MANGGKTEEEKMVKCFKIEFLIIKSLRFSRGAFCLPMQPGVGWGYQNAKYITLDPRRWLGQGNLCHYRGYQENKHF